MKLDKIDLKGAAGVMHHHTMGGGLSHTLGSGGGGMTLPKLTENNNNNNHIVDIEKMYKLSALFTSFIASQNEYFKPPLLQNHSLPPLQPPLLALAPPTILPPPLNLDEPLDLTISSKRKS